MLKTTFDDPIIKTIRDEVKSGKNKIQVAKELQIPLNTVSKNTMDIYKIKKKPDITCKAFLLLQDLMNKGYAFPCSQYGLKEYQLLKKNFSNIYRVKMHGKAIFFLEDKSEIASRAFLESLEKRITDYHRLQRVIRAFRVNISSEERKGYIYKKSKKQGFGKNFEDTRLREKDDSFIKNELFHLLDLTQNYLIFDVFNLFCWA